MKIKPENLKVFGLFNRAGYAMHELGFSVNKYTVWRAAFDSYKMNIDDLKKSGYFVKKVKLKIRPLK